MKKMNSSSAGSSGKRKRWSPSEKLPNVLAGMELGVDGIL